MWSLILRLGANGNAGHIASNGNASEHSNTVKLGEDLKKLRATTLVRLWKMQVLKAQMRSTLDSMDELQREKSDIRF